jgi:CheY-like chemotaxis protein
MANLLMIDDNPIEHLILQKMLDKFNLFPYASHSLDAKVTIQFLEQYQSEVNKLPDVIFLDLNMPSFSGWDFLTTFEKLHERLIKPIDIYIVSSSIDLVDQLLAETHTFVKGSICKPVKMEILIDLYELYRNM